MQIWFFIKKVKKCAVDVLRDIARRIIAWFILGRECERCKHYRWNIVHGFRCCLDSVDCWACEDSITRKHFERK